MSNLLRVGLILIISRAFTILRLLCLCRNREYCANFQNKTVISKQLREGLYSLNYLLPTYRDNVNYYKSGHHPIPTLPAGTGSTQSIFKIYQYINSPFN